jgi:hypothetical protein
VRLLVVGLIAGCSFHSGGGGATGDGGLDGRRDGPSGPDAPPPTSPRVIVFDNSSVATDLVNFPVLVTLDPTTVDYAMVTDPAINLRFRDADSNDLAYEIDHWSPGGSSAVWVRVPKIDGGSSVDQMTMEFGPSVNGNWSPSTVWGSYALVNHLGPVALANSANNATYLANLAGAAIATGQIGTGAFFSGSGSEQVTFMNSGALFDSWNRFSLELWLRPDVDVPLGVEPLFMNKGGPIQLPRVIHNAGGFHFQIDMHFTGAAPDNITYLGAPLTVATWTCIAYNYDGQVLTLYQDGALSDTLDTGTARSLIGGGQQVMLGDATNPFHGMVDELRIAQTQRSADWLKAQYLSMSGQYVTIHAP